MNTGNTKRERLFSVTKKDLTVKTFKSGGPGGQHQNKTDSGVRITHKDSGAFGESRSHKSQYRNKKEALHRLVKHPKFKIWLNIKSHEVITKKTIEQSVEEMVQPQNLKVEVRGEIGKWEEIL